MVKNGFLHCHSMYSQNDSTATPEELVRQAKKMGARFITLTDHGTMLGIEPFMKAGKEYGINTIPGMEIYLKNREHFLLVAKDYTGYQMLSRLLQEADYVELRNKKVYPQISYESLQQLDNKEHLIATSACVQGPIAKILLFNENIKKNMVKKEEHIRKWETDYYTYTNLLKEINYFTEEIKFKKTELTEIKKILAPKMIKRLKKMENETRQLTIFGDQPVNQFNIMKEKIDRARQRQPLLEKEVKELTSVQKDKKKELSGVKNNAKKYKEGKAFIQALKEQMLPDTTLYEKAKALAIKYKNIFPYFFIELQNHGLSMEKQIYPILATIAKEVGIPVIAANDAHMIDQSEDSIEARRLIRFNYFERHQEINPCDAEMYLKSDEELHKALSEILDKDTVEQALDNLCVFHDCHVELPEDKHYPKVPNGDFDALLKNARAEKIKKGEWGQVYEDRLLHEVSVIKNMGYVDYHLVVRDFCIMGRKLGVVPKEERKNIPHDFSNIDQWLKERQYDVGEGIGPGRGSAAGSLVCYLLGITNIDPIKYDLLFERFLNPERVTMPDIDTDVATSLRPILIQYLYWKYGKQAIASITTETTYGAKGALQAVGRDEADRLYGHLPKTEKTKRKSEYMKKYVYPLSDSLAAIGAKIEQIDLSSCNKIEKTLVKKASLLEGKLFSTGIHAGGVVISDNDRISKYIPTSYNAELNVWAVQCDMIRLEEKGFLKFDLLGLKNLDIITDTLHLILKHEGISIDINTIPFEEEVFANIYAAGFTNSVFQFESEGMKKLLKRFKPNCFEDIILLAAAYRPGPMQFLDDIIKVKHNQKKVQYKIKELEDILSVTYGAAIYQEQVMAIFQQLAGYSLGGADLVRRAMSKKKMDKLEKERKSFIYGDKDRGISGCIAKGINETDANDLFDRLIDFARYGFNKSHAASYALVSYQTAWLKYHYPLYFACAMLNNKEKKNYDPIIEDCRKSKIKILPPSILYSYYDFTIEKDAIRFGFRGITGVAEKTTDFIDQIVSCRQKNELNSFLDFYKNTCLSFSPDGKVLQNKEKFIDTLILVGMFDVFSKNREQLLDFYHTLSDNISSLQGNHKKEKISFLLEKYRFPVSGAPDKRFNMMREIEFLGAVYSEDPLKEYGCPYNYGCLPFEQMKNGRNQIMGYIRSVEEKTSKKGKPISILTFTGIDETIQILSLRNRFPDLNKKLFLVVKLYVKKSEQGLFLENIQELSLVHKKKECVFLCDTAEKYQFLQSLFLKEKNKDVEEKNCLLYILSFIDPVTKGNRGFPSVSKALVSEEIYSLLYTR